MPTFAPMRDDVACTLLSMHPVKASKKKDSTIKFISMLVLIVLSVVFVTKYTSTQKRYVFVTNNMYDQDIAGNIRIVDMAKVAKKQGHHVEVLSLYAPMHSTFRQSLKEEKIPSFDTENPYFSSSKQLIEINSHDTRANYFKEGQFDGVYLYNWFWNDAISSVEALVPTIRTHSPDSKIYVIADDVHHRRHLYRNKLIAKHPDFSKMWKSFTMQDNQGKVHDEVARERSVVRNADAVITLSKQMCHDLQKVNTQVPCHVLPWHNNISGVQFPIEKSVMKYEDRSDFAFVGYGSNPTTRISLYWTLKNVFPLLNREARTGSLYVFGSGYDAFQGELQLEFPDVKIIFMGKISASNIQILLGELRIFLAPSLVPVGMSTRILLALGNGIPVVATDESIEGLRDVLGTQVDEVLVTKSWDAQEQADAINLLYTDKKEWTHYAQVSTELAKIAFSDSKFVSNFTSIMDTLNDMEHTSNTKWQDQGVFLKPDAKHDKIATLFPKPASLYEENLYAMENDGGSTVKGGNMDIDIDQHIVSRQEPAFVNSNSLNEYLSTLGSVPEVHTYVHSDTKHFQTMAGTAGGVPCGTNMHPNADFSVCVPDCTCANGTPVAQTGTACPSGGNVCASCTGNYHLSGTSCVANVCTCTGGVASISGCTTHNSEICSSCNTGFYSTGNSCTQNVCTCPGGIARTGSACTANGLNSCSSCYAGYHTSGSTCLPNSCVCSGGTAATGSACTTDGATICNTCQAFFHDNGSSTCVANSCNCSNGVAVSNSACISDQANQCQSCTGAFQLDVPTKSCVTCSPVCSSTQSCISLQCIDNTCVPACGDGFYCRGTTCTVDPNISLPPTPTPNTSTDESQNDGLTGISAIDDNTVALVMAAIALAISVVLVILHLKNRQAHMQIKSVLSEHRDSINMARRLSASQSANNNQIRRGSGATNPNMVQSGYGDSFTATDSSGPNQGFQQGYANNQSYGSYEM